VESIAVLLQYFHLVPSNSTNFAITGTLDNPNIAAMVICMSIPTWIEITRLLKPGYRYFTLLFWIVTVVAFVLLQCRTALIGTAIIVVVYFFGSNWKKFKQLKAISIIVLALLVVGFFILHQQKQASANGRLTIWKVSAEMIAKKPLTGYGYGLFQKEYNLQQADYFNRELRPEQERMNAGYTGMAYNEYLEHTVMGGIPGGLLFTAVMLTLLWTGWKNRDTTLTPFAGVAAFAVMSLFNFTIESPMLLLSFMIYASILLAQNRVHATNKTFVLPKRVTLLCTCIGIAFIVFSIQKYNAQKELKVAKQMLQSGQINSAGMILDEIEPDISTSEAYYRTKTSFYLCHNNYEKALASTIRALNYASYPSLIINAAQFSDKLGKADDVEKYCKVASGIEPHLFRPRVLLMEMYLRTGQNQKAKKIANDILTMKPKINSEKVTEYKLEAKAASDKL
jgi:tetratricopeptide (TPR) repeat protein